MPTDNAIPPITLTPGSKAGRKPAATATARHGRPGRILSGFASGTTIATPTGERRVEELEVGDRVLTRDNGLQTIRWTGSGHLSSDDLRRAPSLRPVLIRRGALDQGLPEADILVSPLHNILIRNDKAAQFFEDSEVLAAAGHLTGLDGVDVVDVSAITYCHFMFDRHQVVLSNGMWTESFRPDEGIIEGFGSAERRRMFDLFPQLREARGRKAYQPARKALSEAESRLLLK